ncbi:esterase family protein, partial [Nocardia gipuzkoensis]
MVRASKYLAVLASVIVGSFVASGPAAAAPPGARVVASDPIDDSAERIDVYSPAMDKVVSSRVIRAAGGGPAPTLYLLTG